MLHTEIIDSYLMAFSAANPRSISPKIEYARGWFIMTYDGAVPSINRYRRSAMIEMTKQLRLRGK